MSQTLLVIKLENGKIQVTEETPKETPSYVARLNYYEQNTPNGCWLTCKLAVAVAAKDIEEVKEMGVRFMERIAEQLDWVEIVNAFMDFAMSVAEPYTTPGAEVYIKDTGGDYPEITIDITYIG